MLIKKNFQEGKNLASIAICLQIILSMLQNNVLDSSSISAQRRKKYFQPSAPSYFYMPEILLHEHGHDT